MNKMSFTEEDKQKVTDFISMLTKHARFDVNTVELVAYFRLFAHMQTKILPKIEANILEVKRIVEPQEPTESQEGSEDS